MTWIMAPAPHITARISTPFLFWIMIAALLPAIGLNIYLGGLSVFVLILSCASSAMFAEGIIAWLRKKPITLTNGAACLTGILLAFIVPGVPWWIASLSGMFAVAASKIIRWNLGYSLFHAALLGRIIVMIFFGNTSEVFSVQLLVALGIGGLFLIYMQIIDWRIPLFSLGIIFLGTMIMNQSLLPMMMNGNLMLAAFFIATDYETSPLLPIGKIVFAIGCGIMMLVLSIVSREMVNEIMLALILMNSLTPLIDNITFRYYQWVKISRNTKKTIIH